MILENKAQEDCGRANADNRLSRLWENNHFA